MFAIRHASLLALAAAAFVPDAHAARAYDSCTGYIESVPTVITTSGTWCMRRDLATSINTGPVIAIVTNNVTIDCNDFKLGGLGAGPETTALGIQTSNNPANLVIRNCNIRGFMKGMQLYGARGAVVENNRLDTNRYAGIEVGGSGVLVRGNTVANTGGVGYAYGILTQGTADVIDNLVDGVDGPIEAAGILANGNIQGSISGNTVRRLSAPGGAPGIRLTTGMLFSSQVSITDNVLMSYGSVGIDCTAATASRARGNRISNFSVPLAGCRDDGNSY